MNIFIEKVASNEIHTSRELKDFYKKTVKELHPDLKGPTSHHHDFDQIKMDYREAVRYLENQGKGDFRTTNSADSAAQPRASAGNAESMVPTSPAQALGSREDFLEEFRELFARGFPVNPRLLTKNKAYVISIQKVEQFLAAQFKRKDFFATANSEIITLKKEFPKTYWYVQQIIWNIGDFRHTGFDYYLRIAVRHLQFIRMTFVENRLFTIMELLEYIVG